MKGNDHCTTAAELPRTWERTGRHPRLPDGDLGAFELEHGLCLYDRADPGSYIIGDAVEVGEQH